MISFLKDFFTPELFIQTLLCVALTWIIAIIGDRIFTRLQKPK